MSEARFVSGRAARLTGAFLAVAAVSACTDGQPLSFLQNTGAKEQVSRNANTATKLSQRDVEAPSVFSATEAGLWDGRPSLGGVWVAHPDVDEPERVIIRNTANGQVVIGALFRRERDQPGPRIQVSSDAAEALELLAGAPEKLSVIALRREEIEEAPVDSADPETPAIAAVEPVSEAPVVSAETLPAPVENATAEPDAIAADTAEALAATRPPAGPVPGSDAEQISDADEAPTYSTAEAPARKGWFGQRLFGKARTEAMDAEALAASEAEPEVIGETVETALAEDRPERKPLFGKPLFGRNADKVGEPLSVLNPQPVAAVLNEAEAVAAAPLPAAAPASAPAAPASAPAPWKSGLEKPYIQVGIFNVQDNAGRTANRMREAGMVPTIFEQSSSGKTFWRVVVGPARTGSERTALLDKIKDVGFTDAYAVTN